MRSGGPPMLNRLSVNTLLKSAIVTIAAVIVMMIAARAWESWQRLSATNRIATVAEASRNAFKAMHTLRTDRATTFRELVNAGTIEPSVSTYVRGVRDAENPAMQAAADLAATLDFADQPALVSSLRQSIKTLTALQNESW